MREKVWDQQKNHEKRLNKEEIVRKMQLWIAVSIEGCIGVGNRGGYPGGRFRVTGECRGQEMAGLVPSQRGVAARDFIIPD